MEVARLSPGPVASPPVAPRPGGQALYGTQVPAVPTARDLACMDEPDLFFAGVRPAIDVGISVSRVGGKAQIPAMKQIAGSLRLDLAAFRELEAFAQLGTELDKATQAQLDRGYRMVEVLKQPQFKPMHVADQIMIIYAGTKGYLDKVPVRQVAAWEEQFLRFVREQRPQVRQAILKERKLTPAVEEQLKAAIQAFAPLYKAPGAVS